MQIGIHVPGPLQSRMSGRDFHTIEIDAKHAINVVYTVLSHDCATSLLLQKYITNTPENHHDYPAKDLENKNTNDSHIIW